MGWFPVVGRLHVREYVALVISFILIGLESIIRVITLALPGPAIRFFYNTSRKLFNTLSSPQGRRSRNRKKAIVTSIAQASDFVEICDLFGYYAEEHIVQTGDGYLLGLHRLGWRRDEVSRPVNRGPNSLQKRVIYMHHGLLMNSEVWVCLTEEEKCLPFLLVERGYDVWLGNNRGNKYSKKSIRCAPTENRFWNFSIDQFAFHDVPDSINYILSTTGQKSLSYIGFSQGTAQAFASLSINPSLNEKVNMFVALAPAMSPSGLSHGIVDTFIKTSPELLFLAFGRRSILSSATMWQAILYPPIFIRTIDIAVSFLFGWRTKNIPTHQKLAAYPHLYSFTSTKSVVHWFQIMRNGVFQMFDDEVQGPLNVAKGAKYYKVAKFPTRNIKTPIVMVYGGSDSLVDINVMLKELPRHTRVVGVPHYEHLDFLWAADVNQYVFPHVLDALASASTPIPRTKRESPISYRDYTHATSGKHTFNEPESDGRDYYHYYATNADIDPDVDADAEADADIDSPIRSRLTHSMENSPPDSQSYYPELPSKPELYSHIPQPVSKPSSPSAQPAQHLRPKNRFPSHSSQGMSYTLSNAQVQAQAQMHSPTLSASHATTERSSTSRPEGWWSSDEVVGTESSTLSKASTREKENPREKTKSSSEHARDLAADASATGVNTNTNTNNANKNNNNANANAVPAPKHSTHGGSNSNKNASGNAGAATSIGAGGISIGASRAVGGLSNRDALGVSSSSTTSSVVRTSSLDSRGRRRGRRRG